MRARWLVVVCVAVLAACGGGGGGEQTQSRFLSLGTAPPGGAFFVVGGAIAETLNENAGENGWDVTAEATKGSQENIRRLASGELDLALANSAISYFAYRGTEGWDRAYPLRVVMTLAPNVAMFVTDAGSPVQGMSDLAGRRVVVGPAGAGFEYFLRPLLGAHGVTYDDFTPLNGTQDAAVDMLADGSAVAAFLGGAVPTASITRISASRDVRLVPFDPAAVEALVSDYLFFRPATIPAGTYRGQDADFHGLDVGSMHLVTSEGADEDRVYALTKTIYENRAEVTSKHPAGRAINERNVIRDTGVPFHPGAIRYYREIGIWPEGR